MLLQRETVGQIPVRFMTGDVVDVLNACRLPKVEEVVHTGAVVGVTSVTTTDEPIYWVSGRTVGLSARVLRLVQRAR